MPGQLDTSPDEEGTEQDECKRKRLQGRSADSDEDRPHAEGQQDADEQHALVQDRRHCELCQDDGEHEQVVDAQGLLNKVRREVLGTELASRPDPHPNAERHRRSDVEHRPAGRFAERHIVRVPRGDEVDDEQRNDRCNGDDPGGHRHVHQRGPLSGPISASTAGGAHSRLEAERGQSFTTQKGRPQPPLRVEQHAYQVR